MKRNMRIKALVMAGALTVSNFGGLAIPMVAHAAIAAITAFAVEDEGAATSLALSNGYSETAKTLSIELTGGGKTGDTLPANIKGVVVPTVTKDIDGAGPAIAKTFGGLTLVEQTPDDSGTDVVLKWSLVVPAGLEPATYAITFPGLNGRADTVYTITVDDDRASEIAILDPDLADDYMAGMPYDSNFDGKTTITINSSTDIKRYALGVGLIDRTAAKPTFSLDGGTLFKQKVAAQDAAYIKWTSSNDNVVTVDNGETADAACIVEGAIPVSANTTDTFITPIGTGNATVTATAFYKKGNGEYEQGKSASIDITVEAIADTIMITKNDKNVSGTTIDLDDETKTVELEAVLSNASFSAAETRAFELSGDIMWVSEDSNIVSVDASGKKATVSRAGNTGVPVGVAAFVVTSKYPKNSTYGTVTDAAGTAVVETVDFTSTGIDVKLIPSFETTTLYVEGKTDIAARTNSALAAAEKADVGDIVYTFKSSDENIISVTKSTERNVYDVATIEAKKSGIAKVVITGSYLELNATTGKTSPATITAEVIVTVLNKDGSLDKSDAEKAAEEAAKKAAEEAAAKKAVEEAAAKKAAEEAAAKKAAEEEAKKGVPAGTTKTVSGTTYKGIDGTSVQVTKTANKKSVKIGKTVTVDGKVLKVTKIGSKAVTGKKVKNVTIDASNIKKASNININMFKGAKNLTSVKIKGAKKGSAVYKRIVKAAQKVNKNVKIK